MRTFTVYFKKEIKESLRQYRYLILAFGFVFFAVLEPIMLKLLPKILKNQIPANLETMFKFTARAAFDNYLNKDITQMCMWITILALMGIVANEIKQGKLILPFSKGANLKQVILAKGIHYSITLLVFIAAGFFIDAYYANVLFTKNKVSFEILPQAIFLVWFYFVFVVAIIIMFNVIIKNSIVSGVAAILVNFLLAFFCNIKQIQYFVPYSLINNAGNEKFFTGDEWYKIIISSAVYIIIAYLISMFRVNIKNSSN